MISRTSYFQFHSLLPLSDFVASCMVAALGVTYCFSSRLHCCAGQALAAGNARVQPSPIRAAPVSYIPRTTASNYILFTTLRATAFRATRSARPVLQLRAAVLSAAVRGAVIQPVCTSVGDCAVAEAGESTNTPYTYREHAARSTFAFSRQEVTPSYKAREKKKKKKKKKQTKKLSAKENPDAG